MTPSQAFDAAYRASRDPRIQALYTIADPMTRYNTALGLALKGLAIDNEIDVRGADPYLEMLFRENDGITWVPNVLQPNVAPGVLPPGVTPNPPFVPYDPTNPPPGSLLVSTDPAKFPPWPVPPPPPPGQTPAVPMPKPGDVLVGPPKTPTMNDLTTLARTMDLPDGFTWQQDGHTYLMHIVSFGVHIWERVF